MGINNNKKLIEAYKAYNHIYNDKKCNQKNVKECKKRNSLISSKLHMICISSNNERHPVPKTFTTLHSTSLSFTQVHI